jgi:hypothetical protein
MRKLSIIALFAVFGAVSACTQPSDAPNVMAAPVQQASVAVPGNSTPLPNLQQLTYKVGPFSLPAGQKATTMWEAPGAINFKVDDPLWLISFRPSIEDASGRELPDRLLNLAVLTNGGEKNPLCTEKEVSNPFFAATAVTKSIELPDGQGYAVLPGDSLDAKVILQNPTTQDFGEVYFKFTITAMPMKNAKNYKDVQPLLLNVDPCDYYPLSVAPKEFVKKVVQFTVPTDGYLSKAYGLLQDYGVKVSLTEDGQPTPFWESQAELTSDHKIEGLAPFEDPAGIPLKAGDELSLEVAYDNQGDDWQSSATGAVMAYIARIENDESPAKAMPAVSAQIKLLK